MEVTAGSTKDSANYSTRHRNETNNSENNTTITKNNASVSCGDNNNYQKTTSRYLYTKRSTFAQVLATLGFGILMIGLGLVYQMPTIVVGGLLNADTEHTELFALDDEAASWFGSIILISQPLGSVTSGFLQDYLGRKGNMMMVTVPQFTGWIMMYFSMNIYFLYIGGALLGLSIGFMEAPMLSYIGETCEPHLRGALSELSELCGGIGLLIESLIGALTDWRHTCLISATAPVISLISLSLIPESPTWLLINGRESDAERALCWLRGWVQPAVIKNEFIDLITYTKSSLKEESTHTQTGQIQNGHTKAENKSNQNYVMRTFALLSKPHIYRPLRLVAIAFFISHNVILLGVRPFLVPIFEQIGMPLKPLWVLVISIGLQNIGSLFGMASIMLFGKRKTNFLSITVCLLCCYMLGVSNLLNNPISWIPFALFCINFFSAGFGALLIPWALVSEVFPIEGRGIAGGVSAALSYFLGFIVTKTYINLDKWFTFYGACFIYGSIGIFGLIYLYFNMPETEGKTLNEIERFLKSNGNNESDSTDETVFTKL